MRTFAIFALVVAAQAYAGPSAPAQEGDGTQPAGATGSDA